MPCPNTSGTNESCPTIDTSSNSDDTHRYILFVLDISGSINKSNFNDLKANLYLLLQLLCNETKVAVMTFSHLYYIEFNFTSFSRHTPTAIIKDAICGINYRGGGRTHTAGAVQCVCKNFLQNAMHINVVFITDGKSNDPKRNISCEINCLHNRSDVDTYAFGITDNVNENELCGIAKNSITSDNVFPKLFKDVVEEIRMTVSDPKYTCSG